MRLIFIRHTSVDVPKGVCYGQTDVPLAASFDEEAAEVKDKLMRYQIDEVYTSPLSRCCRLAEYCGFPDAKRDERLMEMNFGEWEMKRFDEINDPRLRLWYADYLNVAATGGESAMMQRDRFEDFFKSLESESTKTVAIFTHGGILVHALVLLKRFSYKEAYAMNLPYGSVMAIEYEPK